MSRLIDREPNVRTKPMQVIAVGMCRTGTLGLYWALNMLGYRTYHMVEVLDNPERELPILIEAYNEKYNGGRPYGREEFDKWYGKYNAVCDVPGALFVEELYAAYPDAKFILTDRNVDAWVRSMHKTAFECCESKTLWFFHLIEWRVIRPFYQLCLSFSIEYWCWPDDSRTADMYHQHIKRVKATIPSEQLLYLRLEEGITWEKLCTFLDKPIPDQPLPSGKTNGPDHFQMIAQKVVNRALMGLAKRVLLYSCVPVITAGAWYLHRNPGGLRLSWS